MGNKLQRPNAGQGMGIAALVLGTIAFIASFIPCFGIIAVIFGVLAIVFGAIGVSQAKSENVSATLPRAGLILGVLATLFVIIWIALFVKDLSSDVVDNKNEITKALDSAKVDSVRIQDSIDAHEIDIDTIKVEDIK